MASLGSGEAKLTIETGSVSSYIRRATGWGIGGLLWSYDAPAGVVSAGQRTSGAPFDTGTGRSPSVPVPCCHRRADPVRGRAGRPPCQGTAGPILDTAHVGTDRSARSVPAQGRGLALVALAGVIWGTTGALVQLTVERSALTPLTISAYRAFAAGGVFVVVLALTGRRRRSVSSTRGQRRRLALVGVLIAMSQLLFFMSVAWAGVSLATVICMGFAPVLLLAVTSVRRRHLPTRPQIVTGTVAVSGLLLISLVGGGREHAPHPAMGVLAALGAGGCFAFTADVGASLSQRVDPLTITSGIMVVAAAVLD